MSEINRIGIDVGFGAVKAFCLNGQAQSSVTFPSVLGQAQELGTITLGLGGRRARATRLVYDGVEYYTGEEAIEYSRTQASRQDRLRIGSTEERVLMLAALARLNVSEAFIVTGLPVLWFEDNRQVRRSWQSEHCFTWGKAERAIKIHKVLVRPQPWGGFYSWALGNDGRAIIGEEEMLRSYALLDVGWNTTDLNAIVGLKPAPRWSGGEQIGMRQVAQIIGDWLSRQFKLEMTLHEIDQALRIGHTHIYGTRIELADITRSATEAVAEQIVTKATNLWGNGERFGRVFILGGEAVVLGRALKSAFPANGELLDSPALANAYGFAKYAQRDVF